MIIPVLLYHDVQLESNIRNIFISVSENKFKKDMVFVQQNFTPIFVQDLVDYVYQSKPLPEKPILITFDDGYAGLYDYAYTILSELQIKATIALIVNSIGKGESDGQFQKLNWDQIKEMYTSGFVDFQSHSYDLHSEHDRKGCLKKENEDTNKYITLFREDLLLAKNIIENKLNNNVIAYFYPYGYHDDLSEHVLQNYSPYLLSFITQYKHKKVLFSININDRLSLYKIQRFNINNNVYLNSMKNL